MKSFPVIITTFALSYLVVAFMTFGSVYNSFGDCGPKPSTDNLQGYFDWASCTTDITKYRDNSAAMAGAFWPIYWAGKAAVEGTK